MGAPGFEIGDRVKRKSSGSAMTIDCFDTIGSQPSAWRIWFVGSQSNDAEFALAALRKTPPAVGPVRRTRRGSSGSPEPHFSQFHLSVKVIVLFRGSCFFGMAPMSTTMGTFASKPARIHVPVGRSGT